MLRAGELFEEIRHLTGFQCLKTEALFREHVFAQKMSMKLGAGAPRG